MQLQESAEVGERLLVQALRSLKVEPDEISWDRWDALQRSTAPRAREILADIGLGKRLAFVVAKALTRQGGAGEEPATRAVAKRGAITIRGTEGLAIQFAPCCRPIPGDPIIAQIHKGQGLIVHQRDCVTLRKQRIDAGELVDVEWAPDVTGVFEAGIRALVADRPRLLAELATQISRRRREHRHRLDGAPRSRRGARDLLRRAGARPAPPRAGDPCAEARARSAPHRPRANVVVRVARRATDSGSSRVALRASRVAQSIAQTRDRARHARQQRGRRRP